MATDGGAQLNAEERRREVRTQGNPGGEGGEEVGGGEGVKGGEGGRGGEEEQSFCFDLKLGDYVERATDAAVTQGEEGREGVRVWSGDGGGWDERALGALLQYRAQVCQKSRISSSKRALLHRYRPCRTPK